MATNSSCHAGHRKMRMASASTRDVSPASGSEARTPATRGSGDRPPRITERSIPAGSDLHRADGAEDHDGRRPVVLAAQVRLPAARIVVRVAAAVLAHEHPGALRLELVVHTPSCRRGRGRRQVAETGRSLIGASGVQTADSAPLLVSFGDACARRPASSLDSAA